MVQERKNIEPRRQFLVLLLCYYALPVLESVWKCVNLIDNPSYYWERFLFRNGDVITAMFTIFAFAVLITLLRIKEYNTDKRYKIGLLLMLANPICSVVTDLLQATSPESLSGFYYVALLGNIVAIVGIFLFINASPVDRKVNIFVKCTPFIPSVIISLLGFVLIIAPMQYYILADNLALFVTLLLLLRKK